MKFKREFDIIILADVVEHVRGAKPLLESIQKFVKPDGTIIISVPNIAIWFYRLSLLLGRFNYGPKGTLDETHVHFYTKSTLQQLLDRSGLQVKKWSYTGLPFEIVFESIGKSKILRFIDWLYYQLARVWPSLFAYQFVVEAEIKSFDTSKGEGKI
jgi:2-polyprenyl-3-methyl-5-hydroxy-6-metoxy-1,4-benzoquinol methylase